MVVLFFATAKNKTSNYSNKEYCEHIKKGVLKEDANKCISIELSVMKDLKMTSLDNLLKVSDDIAKVQFDIEGFLKSLEKKLGDLHPEYKLSVNIKNKPHKIKEGIMAFSWDEQKYPKGQKSIENVLERILDKLNTTKGNLKTKADDYSAEVEKLKQKQKSDIEARAFMKKDYREIMKNKTELMVKSSYLTSLLVFVPHSNADLFKQKYEYLVKDCVVPGSAHQLCTNEDDKVKLFRVVIMSHLKDDYINELRKVCKSNAKEYDENEVSMLPTLLMEQKTLEANIEDKKVSVEYFHLFNFLFLVWINSICK